jgi:HlyD family secretion protein
MKQLLALLVIIAVVAAGVGYYFTHQGKAAIPEYRGEKVDRGPIKDKVSATGKLQPTEQEIVGSDIVVGRVVEIYDGADMGKEVSEGQRLLRLDDELARAKLKASEAERTAAKSDLKRAEAARDTAQVGKRQAESTYDYAEKELKRIEELAATPNTNVSKAQLEAVKSKVEQAKEGVAVAEAQIKQADAGFVAAQGKVMAAEAGVDAAQKAVDMMVIKAPVAGTIIDKRVVKGQVISPQTSPILFVIVPDLTKMQVLTQVGESDILKVTEGKDVQFTVNAESSEAFQGKVSKISIIPIMTQTRIPQLGEAANSLAGPVYYHVWVDVVPSSEGSNEKKRSSALRPGLNASVDIILRREEDVLRVPAAALNFQPNDVTPDEQRKVADGVSRGLSPVWVLTGAGQRRLVLVQPGATEGNRTEILKTEGDLKEGMDVIIEGPPPEKRGGIFETKTNIRI